MPVLPLGLGAYNRAESYLPEVVLRNLLLEPEKTGLSPDQIVRITRPGLTLVRTYALGSEQFMRGVFTQAGVLDGATIAVAGKRFYHGADYIFGVGGEGPVSMSATDFGVFLANGEQAWAYDGTDETPIAMPDEREVIDLDTLAGYVILGCPDGRFYWLEPGETEVDALNFATAESAPDGLVAIRRVGDEVWLFGQSSIEPWQLTGDADAPFQRAVGRQYDRGCLSGATVRRIDNSVLWVGDDGMVYRGSALPTRVSQAGIEERIARATGTLQAWVMETEAHKVYVLDIPGEGTFGLDMASNEWSEFATGADTGWRAHTGISTSLGVFAGDRESGKLWRVDADADDDGEPIISTVTGFAPVATKPPRVDSFSVGMGVDEDADVTIRWKDGQDDYPTFPEQLEARAPYDVVNLYRLGSPDRPGRTFEVSCSVRCSFYGAMVNEAWQ